MREIEGLKSLGKRCVGKPRRRAFQRWAAQQQQTSGRRAADEQRGSTLFVARRFATNQFNDIQENYEHAPFFAPVCGEYAPSFRVFLSCFVEELQIVEVHGIRELQLHCHFGLASFSRAKLILPHGAMGKAFSRGVLRVATVHCERSCCPPSLATRSGRLLLHSRARCCAAL